MVFKYKLTVNDVFSEEDPTSSEQCSESEEESDEKPDSCSANAETSVCERIAAKLAVRNGVHPGNIIVFY